MQMLLFYYFSFVSVSYVYFLLFLSKRPKNVTLCYMNVCILIYLWFAKMKIWSMLQVLSQENEKKKKITQNDSLHICVMVKGVFIWGGFQGVKKDRRLQSLKI